MEPVSNQRLLLSGNGVSVQGCVVRQGIPVSVYRFYDLLAIGITNQVAFDVQAAGVYFLAVPAVAHQILGNAHALLKVKIPIAVGKQQTPLPGLYGLARRVGRAPDLQEKVNIAAGGIIPIGMHGLHAQDLAVDGPVVRGVFLGGLIGIRGGLRSHLGDLHLQHSEVIGRVGKIVYAGVGYIRGGGVKVTQRAQLRTVSADKAHCGLAADDAPVSLGGLLQKRIGFICGANVHPYSAAAGHKLLHAAGDHRHRGVVFLHCGPGLGSGPVLAAGQAQNGPGQGQQQNAEGRLHWPPGQLVQRVHRRDSFLQNRLLMLNYTDSLS